MTSATTDAFSLTRLFIAPGQAIAAPPTLAQDVAGGVLLSWDPVSFANLVQIGPIVFQNLPVLSPGLLTLGNVLLLKAPGGYIIMGNLGSVRGATLLEPLRYRALIGDIPLTSTTLVNAGILNFLVNPNRQYGIDGIMFYNTSSSSDISFAWDGPANMSVKWGVTGITVATVLNGFSAAAANTYGDSAILGVGGSGSPEYSLMSGWFATTDTPGIIQLRVGLNSGSTAGTLQQGSWLRITELGSFGGANTFIKLYPATGSRSYDHNGNFIGSPDGDNNMYSWSLSGRSFGNEANMWTFDAATMRSDLAGATILSAQMYFYCFSSSSTPADWTWLWSTNSTIAATFPNNGFGGMDVKNLWTPPGWNSFDMTTGIGNVLHNNANSVLGGSYNFTDSATGMRGFGFSAATRPYIQVTYSV